MNELITTGKPKLTMSSREIAEVVESRHDSVKRTIDRLVDSEIIVQPPTVDEQIQDDLGRPRTVRVYLLDKRSSLIVVAQLCPEFTARIVDRWQELEAQLAAPKLPDFTNPAIAARAWAEQFEQREAAEERSRQLAATVEEQAPKVAFHDAVAVAINSQSIQEVAKILGTGERRLFKFLRDEHLLMSDNLPYQEHIDNGRFRVIERQYQDYQGETHTYSRTLVTGKGLQFLQKRFAVVA